MIAVDSGNKGIDVLKEQGPVAVVVSDYSMPEMDGVQFLSIVSGRLCLIPYVYCFRAFFLTEFIVFAGCNEKLNFL